MNESKEHILLTSLTLFLQKSFKEVTMKEIVDKTGLSKGAFYHYFNSKEEVFSEVINHFFTGMMTVDFNTLARDSLQAFYLDMLEKFEEGRENMSRILPKDKDRIFSSNFYYLLFDAIRMLPKFRAKHHLLQKEELKAWKNMVNFARKQNEISTDMTNEQVAKLFIYLSDGTNLNLILGNQVNKKKNELKNLWDGLYNSLKA
ncbi:DNA-binding transcriptional regulator, AcrR family [Pseudarcicella hirudinis]|uniref:DNA-binding transcriptional regulator, AcrR family n=1 Tax=Pseudarcicella hirudinis TaxID=1079859 RepID=A0A1I5VLP6_9BACT|nr:TetR/AcrR family transcriptional regulator [Pseudarcicella hirudinis]SFQ07906.1 DNA-binding transcriptional regulator, AcrR family [Pseudarcicella hirudinis]